MNSTEMPSSASAATRRWISALAPTSMPRVGSSSSSSLGAVSSQRASSTFCWLPPESVADDRLGIGWADVEGLHVAVGELGLLASRDRARPAARRLHRQHDVGANAEVADEALGRAGSRRRRRCPWRGRRVGCAAVPADRRWSPRRCRRGRRRTAGARVSVRPEPSRPAMPTTSPRVDVEVERVDARLAAEPGGAQERGAAPRSVGVLRLVSRGRRGRRARGRSSSTPARAGAARPARYSPTRRPLRSTVMRSAIWYTWSRKWVTNSIATPASRSRRPRRTARSTSSRVEAGGGLVEDQHPGVDLHRAGDRDELLHGDRVRLERRARVDVEVQLLEHLGGCAGASPASRCGRSGAARGPSIMFSATDRLGSRLTSWYTVLMPASCAWRRAGEPRSARRRRGCSPQSMLVDAGERLDERRLAGAVLAHQGVHLAREQAEVDTVERLDAGEARW